MELFEELRLTKGLFCFLSAPAMSKTPTQSAEPFLQAVEQRVPVRVRPVCTVRHPAEVFVENFFKFVGVFVVDKLKQVRPVGIRPDWDEVQQRFGDFVELFVVAYSVKAA